jgi:mRNA interferase YafQ
VYEIRQTSAFKKDLKRLIRQKTDLTELELVVDDLAAGKTLDPKYKDHALVGNWKGFRDCHIAPDWVLLYKIERQYLILTLTRTGSHSELEL